MSEYMNSTQKSNPELNIELGNKNPYDIPAWMFNEVKKETDWAIIAARGVLFDLLDRRGVKQELYNIDFDVRAEMIRSLAETIRLAYILFG